MIRDYHVDDLEGRKNLSITIFTLCLSFLVFSLMHRCYCKCDLVLIILADPTFSQRSLFISNCRLFGIYLFLQQIVMILSTLIQRDSLSIANRAG